MISRPPKIAIHSMASIPPYLLPCFCRHSDG